MRHINVRWIYIIVGVLLLALSDYVNSAFPLIAGSLLVIFGIYGSSFETEGLSDEEIQITEETHYFGQEEDDESC